MYDRRNRSSGGRSAPATPSPYNSHYSGGSSGSRKSSSAARTAAGWVARVFVNCFTPPDDSVSKVSLDSGSSYGKRRNSEGSNYKDWSKSTRGIEVGSLIFTMEDVYNATKNFSPSLKIGQGGFGIVYKGTMNDGMVVAIKRAKKVVYDSHPDAEFQNEIHTLAQIEHLNLVKFYGYLVHEDERILVVEYVPNGTLREHLDCKHGIALDLAARIDIAIDVAHAITYLHMYTDHPIIHRDIKSTNILLTESLRAKVADFGFARLVDDAECGDTHVSTQVKGTAGYLDPQYLTTYHLTEKSDVYSFGALLVEMVTGRRPIEPERERRERVTATWAIRKFNVGDSISILDRRLEHTPVNILALERILELAFRCLSPKREPRPSMEKCGEILRRIRKDYREQYALDSSHPLASPPSPGRSSITQ